MSATDAYLQSRDQLLHLRGEHGHAAASADYPTQQGARYQCNHENDSRVLVHRVDPNVGLADAFFSMVRRA